MKIFGLIICNLPNSYSVVLVYKVFLSIWLRKSLTITYIQTVDKLFLTIGIGW